MHSQWRNVEKRQKKIGEEENERTEKKGRGRERMRRRRDKDDRSTVTTTTSHNHFIIVINNTYNQSFLHLLKAYTEPAEITPCPASVSTPSSTLSFPK